MSWLRSKLRFVAARASDVLAQAADMVSPTLYASRVDEFHHRWTTVERFLESVVSRDLEPAEQRRLLLESQTRDSLLKLVLLIYEEENNSDRWEMAMARPKAAAEDAANDSQTHSQHECLEYLLLRQIIPQLCEAGKRDQPCGIMSLAMQFVAALLSRVTYPILPTREVHESILALIHAAARKEVEDPTVRKHLIYLLNTLWKKLRGDPVQTEFFFLQADRLMVRTTDMVQQSDGSVSLHSASDDPFLHLHNHHTQSEVPELILFTGLLPHMYAMGKIGEKCREALVIAAAMHDKALCRFVLQLTPFCHYAVNGVISAFDGLPKTLASTTKASTVIASSVDPNENMDVELRFLAVRLRFCCTLAMVARYELEEVDELTGELQRQSIADELLDQFRTRFLEGPLLEGLLHTSEAAACATTLYARIILEELTACGRNTRANPLLFIYLQFLLEGMPVSTKDMSLDMSVSATEERDEISAPDDSETLANKFSGPLQLPSELLRHVTSLSSSLCITTIDLFTSVLELQDDYADDLLLGTDKRRVDNGIEVSPRKHVQTASLSSPNASTNGAIWFASRFPESSVASNVHLWKIRAFAGPENVAEIPAADDQEDQVLSLLSYIADAEYAACQRGPEDVDEPDEDEADMQEKATVFTTTESEIGNEFVSTVAVGSTTSPSRRSSSRTAAKRNTMKPLRDVYLSISLPSFSPAEPIGLRERTQSLGQQKLSVKSDKGNLPLFLHIVLRRVERLLDSSFQENLALSGLIYALAQKTRCSAVVFDLDEVFPPGQSLRSVLEELYAEALRRLNHMPDSATQLQDLRKKLMKKDNDEALNDHEAGTRLLCAYVVLDEILKELCSLLFARERVQTLPLRPEGYYLEPKRPESLSPSRTTQRERALSSETLFLDDDSQVDDRASLHRQGSISKEFEALLAEAQSSMDDLLVGPGAVVPGLELELETHVE
ncbi:hypothetical protein PsorP6_001230 [Peronosclerospora sorghi]|uniref:Uncharacterized protein n=1 Tax=Peronosclerospora sorghi TaxID=230839 RepID=A0ACC0WUC6_9STRA|nr:hypothetical protein PsorP6_001230 [Peronosclerospora sorghi]